MINEERKLLYKLIEIANGLNVKLKLNYGLDFAGRVYYKKSLIEINEPIAKYALMTLAHELGHYVFYLNNKENCQPPIVVREKAANRIGWYLLRKIEADIISKEDWVIFHIDNLKDLKDTGGWEIEN